jgi:starvation-inducible DNA-binding protein
LLLDEQADQLFTMTDPIAERIRKIGGTTLRSIGHIARLQRVSDNDALYVEPEREQFCRRRKLAFPHPIGFQEW